MYDMFALSEEGDELDFCSVLQLQAVRDVNCRCGDQGLAPFPLNAVKEKKRWELL